VLVSEKIIAALKDSDKPLTTLELVKRTGVTLPQTYLPLFRLKQAGTITRNQNGEGHYIYAIDNSVINSNPAPKSDAPKPNKKVGRPLGSTKKPQPLPAPKPPTLAEVAKFVHGSWVTVAEHESVKKQRDAYEKQWLDSLAVIDYLERKFKGQ
jgi:hypothetical protein